MDKSQLIEETIEALRDFEVGREQLNERSAMTLLALLQLKPGDDWARATNPMLGTRAIMDWIRDQYGVEYAANTRERPSDASHCTSSSSRNWSRRTPTNRTGPSTPRNGTTA